MNAPAGPDLRDIHLPPPPSWWPPAPGWWLIAALLLAAIAVSAWIFMRRWREQRWRMRVAAELDRIAALHAAQPDDVRFASDVSHLLRRASRLIEPEAAALQGEAWLAFLDRQFDAPANGKSDAARFRTDTGRALIDAPYRRANDAGAPRVDATALFELTREWLKRALPHGRSGV
ncbi:MAG: DUF4381 domain-containing protein [Rhodanobacteraceae bacterium]